MSTIVGYKKGSQISGAYPDTSAGPSPTIWGNCPSPEELAMGPRTGFGFATRFEDSQFTVPTTEGAWSPLGKAFTSSGGVLSIATANGGGVIMGSDDDNEAACIATKGLPFKILRTGTEFWFEARIQLSTVAITTIGFFIGLFEQQTLTVTQPMADAGTIADNNFVGFHHLEGTASSLSSIYKANGVTQVTVGTAPSYATPVAATSIKVGMHYDPISYDLKFYYNGVPTYTKNIPAAAGTDFPNDVQLGLFAGIKNAAGTSPGTALVQWIRAIQLDA